MTQLIFSIAPLLLISCVSAKKGREMKEDISALNIRLMQLERHTDEKIGKNQTHSEAASKRLASSTTRIDELTTEIQMVRGDIDTLKVGVATGRMPGAPSEQETVADTLDALLTRVGKLEETQVELLGEIETLQKARSSKSKSVSANAKSARRVKKIRSLKDLKGAFSKKRYQDVVQASKNVRKKQKGKVRGEVDFYESESLYLLGRLREAALKYNKLIENYPSGSYIPQARLRMGDCFRHLGDKDTARIYYQELIDSSPDTAQANTAKDRLTKMK